MAVGKRDAGQIPENEHEAPFLVIHVPAYGQIYFKVILHDATYQVVTMFSSPFPQALA